MTLYSFDASAIIDLWVNYPFNNKVFEPLWSKFVENIENEVFVISDIALCEAKLKIDSEEFSHVIENIKIYKKEGVDLIEAQNIKMLLEIEEDNYGGGVGENDIFIIAISKRIQTILINNEKRQPILPSDKSNYKMPAVCNLPRIGVKNINLTDLLHEPSLW